MKTRNIYVDKDKNVYYGPGIPVFIERHLAQGSHVAAVVKTNTRKVIKKTGEVEALMVRHAPGEAFMRDYVGMLHLIDIYRDYVKSELDDFRVVAFDRLRSMDFLLLIDDPFAG